MPHLCVVCKLVVRERQHALECDSCNQWQHRLCGTGISITDYRQWTDAEFTCSVCREPDITEEDEDSFNIEDDHRADVSMVEMLEESLNNTDEAVEQSFNISTDFVTEEAVVESDLEDADPSESIIEDQPVQFHIVEEGSKRRLKKLVSSDGFSYTVKRAGVNSTNWRCSVRSKSAWCKATIIQKGNHYVPGPNPHIHPRDPGLLKKTTVRAEVLKEATTNVYRPSGDIVQDVMTNHIEDDDFNLQKPANLQRSANLHRQKMRPAEPKDLDFQIDTDYLQRIKCEDFVIGDITVGTKRHIMMATQHQLDLLKQAKRWYVDGTFKVVQKPFKQLFSIHAFIQKDTSMKQEPLCFILMSRRQKKDYKALDMKASGLYRCAGDIIYNDQEPVPGHISDVQLKMYSETCNFLQYLKPLTKENPYFFGQIRSLATQSKVTIGIAGPDIKEDAHPGNWNNTVGYHSDTGKCFTSHKENANTNGEKFGIGDVFGVCVTHFGEQMSTVTFVKNGKPVATRYHFEPDHAKFLPTITLENGPIDLGIMWQQAVFGSPQFDEKNMLHWLCDSSVIFDIKDNWFFLNKSKDKIITSAPVQSPQPLCSSFSHFECIIKETTDGAAASVGIGDCSPLKPSPTCEILRDFMTWTADGKVNKVEDNDRVGMGIHYHPDSRTNDSFDDKESQLVLCFVTRNTVTIYAKMIIQPEGGFFPLILLDQNCRKVTVDVESNRKIEIYENLDKVYKEAIEEATKHIIDDCVQREIHINMFRKSDALQVEVPKEPSTDIDLSKLYCRVTLPAETMGIHVIQFNKALTENNSYFCVDIKTLNEDSLITVGIADKSFDLTKHPGKTEKTVGWMSQNGRMYFNTRYEGNVNGQRYEEGDTVGVDLSEFDSPLPVVLFSKNYHPIGLRYLMANDAAEFFPTIALCGNGYEVVLDVFWHNRLCVGPTFEIDNANYWILPEGSKVDEKEKLVTIPEHTDAEVLQCPYPLSEDIKFNYFEIQIIDNFGQQANGIPPPGIALSSPCFQDIGITMSSNFRQDFIRFLAKGEAESSVQVGDTIGWGILVPKSEAEKEQDKLVICYLCINRNIALTRVSYEPPGGFYASILMYPGVNRVKIGRIRYIHTHPITDDKVKILLKDAREIIALEEQAKLEGKDALDVVEDKNSLFRPLPGITDDFDDKPVPKMAKVAATANMIETQKKKMSPDGESKACVIL